MASNKFYGPVGYGETVEVRPGVHKKVITEVMYYGDVVQNTRRLSEADSSVNKDVSVQNSISIIADPYANEHFFAMQYIKWLGTLWVVSNVEVLQGPRLLLRLGGVYNGPTA